MSTVVIVNGRAACLAPMPAERAGVVPASADPGILAHRLGWNAHAAGEYPRPTLEDAAGVAVWRPAYALHAWHHAAGATILGGYCCGTPAAHRDALEALARVIRREVTP